MTNDKRIPYLRSLVVLLAIIAITLICLTAICAAKEITLNLNCVVVMGGSTCSGNQTVKPPANPPPVIPSHTPGRARPDHRRHACDTANRRR